MKKIFFSLSFLLGFFYLWNSEFITSKESINTMNNSSYVLTHKNRGEVDEQFVEKVPEKIDKSNKDISNIRKGKKYVVFETYYLDDALEDMDPIKNVTPISAVQMKQHILENVQIGDSLLLPDIEGNSYEMTVENHTVSKRENISIDGSFKDNGIQYTAIITEGKNASFISMRTPMGNYEIELYNGKGFVYTGHSLEKTMQDFNKNDGIKVTK